MPEGGEKYIPTEAEMESAESKMTDEERNQSQERQELNNLAQQVTKTFFELWVSSNSELNKCNFESVWEYAESLCFHDKETEENGDHNKAKKKISGADLHKSLMMNKKVIFEENSRVNNPPQTEISPETLRDFNPEDVDQNILKGIANMRENLDQVEKQILNVGSYIFQAYNQAENSGNLDRTISEIENLGDIRHQLSLRDKIFRSAFLAGQDKTEIQRFCLCVVSYLNGYQPLGENFSRRDSDAFGEQELIYSALVLSPYFTNRQFLNKAKQIFIKSLKNLSVDNNSLITVPGQALSKLQGVWARKLHQADLNPLFGKTIFEVGGTAANDYFIEKWGAIIAGKAETGHSKYSSIGLSDTGRLEDMIHILNYPGFASSHSADVVCSSRLFDGGSGIGLISKPEDYYASSEEKDDLGQEEMVLVMSNIIKDNGYLLHFNSPYNERLCNSVGWRHIANIQGGNSAGGIDIYRFRQENKDPDFNYVKLGKKEIEFNPESQTWELKTN